ncbi:rubrerythrin-like domain-containing protein [Halopelagius inordinatus]|uniref:rubrerythrin-like domain-containing protein n=1 Tax=Halopelagius inordinatus TaxID=553467 RepID=UPI001160124F|nr:rubrerythrin-like domain-containing protein [Halopelagius inordinatus]
MVFNSTIDPYTPTEGYYECLRCGTRFTAESAVACADCGSEDVRNISVPRE